MSERASQLEAHCAANGAAEAEAVMLTGATGFVGMELLARYLARTERTVYALIRADSAERATQRLRETLACLFEDPEPYRERAIALPGDVSRPALGLRAGLVDSVAREVSEIVHAAASVSFELDLATSREINLEGTRRVLDFAERCDRRGSLRRLCHISTAYVAGEHAGRFGEDDLELGQRFRNPYEQSKYEAELLVGDHRERLPITVVRPSIVVGERDSGWTASFNVLYWPLRALARGAYPVLPARRSAPVDVVSVDYVADAIFALAQAPEAVSQTYHLTASAAATTIGELLELACAHLECPTPPVISPWIYRRTIRPLLWWLRPRTREFLRATDSYLPYFAVEVAYDNARASAALAPAGITPTPLRAYFDRIVDYALLADWGRTPLSRARVALRERRSADADESAIARAREEAFSRISDGVSAA